MPDEAETEREAASLAGLTIDAEGEPSAVIVAIDKAVDAQREQEQQLRTVFGVNNTDFRAMLLIFRLCRRHRVVRAGDLTRGLGISSGTTTQIIGRLTEAGLLTRGSDPADGRVGVLALTDQASERLAASTAALRGDLDALVDSLDDAEQDRIVELLQQVREIFRAHGSSL